MTGPNEMVQMSAFILTILGASLVSLVLVYFSRRSSQERIEGLHSNPDFALGENPFFPQLLQTLGNLPGSAVQHKETAAKISDYFQKKIKEEVETVEHVLHRQHEKALQERTKEVSAVKEKYQETLRRGRQTEMVLRSLAEGLVVINQKGDVVLLNPAAERLLGVSMHEKLKKPLREGLKEEQILSLLQDLDDPQQQEIVFTAGQNSVKRTLRASNAIIEDDNGKTIGMVSVLTDVTHQKEIEVLKSDFVASVTHELRTPLAAVQHSLEIVLDKIVGELSEGQKDLLENAQRNLHRLGDLINNLLDLAKLESSRVDLKIEPAQIGKITEEVCKTFSAWAQAKKIRLLHQVDPQLPPVLLDANRITQVLTNLIGNAIKFTPSEGTITVKGQLASGGEGIEIRVSDTGRGIAAEDIPKLFQKFQQVGERSVEHMTGTGLGLAISKEIIELHRGKIWAQSRVGEGAEFAFVLPLEQKEGALSDAS